MKIGAVRIGGVVLLVAAVTAWSGYSSGHAALAVAMALLGVAGGVLGASASARRFGLEAIVRGLPGGTMGAFIALGDTVGVVPRIAVLVVVTAACGWAVTPVPSQGTGEDPKRPTDG